MSNPYTSYQADSNTQLQPPAKQRGGILVFCTIAYALHAIALWGNACFHEAHIGSELREPFATTNQKFGWTGLLGAAMIYAMVPAGIYRICLLVVRRFVITDDMWLRVLSMARLSLIPALFTDGILGLSLFTTR